MPNCVLVTETNFGQRWDSSLFEHGRISLRTLQRCSASSSTVKLDTQRHVHFESHLHTINYTASPKGTNMHLA